MFSTTNQKKKKQTAGANLGLSHYCDDLLQGNQTAFRTSKACNGTETSLIECGGVKTEEHCDCGVVAKIKCQPAGKKSFAFHGNMQ